MATKSIKKLILELSKLPGVGEKSATRYAFYILNQTDDYAENLAQAILDVKHSVKKCPICGAVCEDDKCDICSNDDRDYSTICVVEDDRDVMIIENTNKFNGAYHILGGNLNPLNGITPDKLNIESLINRVKSTSVREVILALNTSIEGQSTAMYLLQVLKLFDVKITKLASGIPMGSNIEFSDNQTIAQALEGRIEL